MANSRKKVKEFVRLIEGFRATSAACKMISSSEEALCQRDEAKLDDAYNSAARLCIRNLSAV